MVTESDVFQAIPKKYYMEETFEKRRRKGYTIVSNSTLFETNVIFST